MLLLGIILSELNKIIIVPHLVIHGTKDVSGDSVRTL